MVATIYLLEHAEEEVWPISENEQSEEQPHDEQPEHPFANHGMEESICNGALQHSCILASVGTEARGQQLGRFRFNLGGEQFQLFGHSLGGRNFRDEPPLVLLDCKHCHVAFVIKPVDMKTLKLSCSK